MPVGKFSNDLLKYSFFRDISLYLKGSILQKTDGYYFKNENGNDAKIVRSNATHFPANSNGHWYGSHLADKSIIAPTDGVLNEYEYLLKFDSLTNVPTTIQEYNILYTGAIGIVIQQYNDKIRVITYNNATAKRTVTSTIAIPDTTNYHYVKIGFDLRNMSAIKVIVTIDSQTETLNITATGSTYQGATSSVIDRSITAGYTIVYFKVRKSNVVVFHLDFSQQWADTIIDSVTGTVITTMAHYEFVTQDIYPSHLINGYTLYTYGANKIYLPKKEDGTFFSPAITNYTKIGDYEAGNGHNKCESQIFDGTNYYTYLQLIEFPITNKISFKTSALITEMLVFQNTLTNAEKLIVLGFIGWGIEDTAIFLGDSIMHGGVSVKSKLSGDITNAQNNVKIWNYGTSALESLTPDNSDQPITNANGFSCNLNYAFLKNTVLNIVQYAYGGAYLGVEWLPGGVYNLLLKTGITALVQALHLLNKYPRYIGIYATGGQNDSSDQNLINAIAANLINLQADIRTYIDCNPKWHHLLLHETGGYPLRKEVNDNIKAINATAQNMLLYSADDFSYPFDSVHPGTQGILDMGANFYNENHM
ncbi:MAG: hypothetical protein ACOYKE_14800 [Ferruginibacter sp.]